MHLDLWYGQKLLDEMGISLFALNWLWVYFGMLHSRFVQIMLILAVYIKIHKKHQRLIIIFEKYSFKWEFQRVSKTLQKLFYSLNKRHHHWSFGSLSFFIFPGTSQLSVRAFCFSCQCVKRILGGQIMWLFHLPMSEHFAFLC